MTKQILSGNEAVALGAWESGVKVASAYPGTPSTEILENFARYEGVYAEWAPNEKVALEVLAGSSMAGVRTLATMKHVGLNVAADPLMTLAYTGVKGGALLVCADDPGMHSSQNEQDSRYYARFAQIPMLEPSGSQEAKEMVAAALALSEEMDTPAMLRVTTRIAHGKGVVTTGDAPAAESGAGFEPDRPKYCMLPGFAKQRHPLVLERVAKLKAFAEETDLNRIEWGNSGVGVIAAGISYQYVKEVLPDASVLKLGLSFPLPEEKIKAFAAKVDRLMVVEELEPYLEDELSIMGLTVEGKAWFPRIDELNPERVAQGFRKAGVLQDEAPAPPEAIPGADMPRPPLMCAACAHRGLFYALNKMKGIVHGDIGCYTLSALPPLTAIHSCLCMGAGISMAHGTAQAIAAAGGENQQPVFGVIGDSTFFHSGITSLLNVVYNQSDVTIIIMDNRITAMTGGQQNPGTGHTLQKREAPAVDILKLVQTLGVQQAREVDPFNIKETLAALKEATAFKGPAVLVTRRPCVQLLERDARLVRQVDPDACIGCAMCLRLGCPAIAQGDEIPPEKEGKKIRKRALIDATLCRGCSLCEQVCKSKAIAQVS